MVLPFSAMTTHPERRPLRIAYIGNFQPKHSTENHVAETLRRMGHTLNPFQEDDTLSWDRAGQLLLASAPDLVLWTRTGSLSPPDDMALAALDACAEAGVPTVGFHLDRWWGLNREGQVHESPFFQCTLVCTADGGHDEDWRRAGVEHLWLPPAVAEFECGWGRRDPRMVSEVAFVGSWDGYHAEWPWRRRLVRLVAGRYGNQRFRCWPERGGEAVRGDRLRNLYASATVVVGDSCLAGDATRYWSDRIPETLGRGGLLIHPRVPGLERDYRYGEHFLAVEPENIEHMFETIDMALAMPVADQFEIRRAGMLEVLQHHTYRQRMEFLLAELERRGAVAA
jgi:hypothetical protein